LGLLLWIGCRRRVFTRLGIFFLSPRELDCLCSKSPHFPRLVSFRLTHRFNCLPQMVISPFGLNLFFSLKSELPAPSANSATCTNPLPELFRAHDLLLIKKWFTNFLTGPSTSDAPEKEPPLPRLDHTIPTMLLADVAKFFLFLHTDCFYCRSVSTLPVLKHCD